jgi:Mg2+ and Co2+ transporter CorA
MNFSNQMPEFRWPHGYAYVLGLTLVSTGLTFFYFKSKKWL